MRILFLLVVLSVTSALQSQVVIKENAIQSKYAFPLVTSKAKAVVVYDTDDYLVVRKTAELFVSDVESVTGQQLRLTDKLKGDKEIIIVGGDEVPEGIWEGSSICRTFMQENGLTKIRDLKDYFLEQILEMLDKRNIQVVGWQDIVMNPDNTVNEHFKNSKRHFTDRESITVLT